MAEGTSSKLKVGFAGQLRDIEVALPAGEPRPWDADAKLELVGRPAPRIEGPAKVSGAATYTHDVRLPGLLYAAVLRSPHACATLTAIDLEPARGAPGVAAVLPLAKAGERLLFAGQDVAAVAATTPQLARAALERISATYQAEPHVVATRAAMQPGAPLVHRGKVEERATEGDEPGAGGGGPQRGNVRTTPSMKKGDVEKGLRQARVVHEATYSTQVHTHSALETHSIVVRWDGDKKMTVWCSTQGIFSVRDEMAELFGCDRKDVHVITEYLGGGFGAKFGASAPGSRMGFVAGELARVTRAPVALLLDRREEHLCAGNRPDSLQQVALGAAPDGTLTAIKVQAHGSAGVGTGAGVGRNAFGIYTKCPNIRVESHDVFTHAGPGTAFRAPGHPQGAFALELALDELAAKLGKDPLDLRIAHNEHPVRRHQFELGRKHFHWDDLRRRAADQRRRATRVRRGVGVAASIWGDFGRGKAVTATVSVGRDGHVEVRNGLQDIGGGITTVVAQVVGEVLHRPLAAVHVKLGTSDLGPSVGSGGSNTTSSVTPAVRAAAEAVKQQLTELARQQLGARRVEDVVWDAAGVRVGGKSLTFAELCKKISGEAIVAAGSRPETYGAYPMKFMGGNSYQIAGVQFAEVEVDTWTGVVKATRVLAVHDCGRVMNELTTRSQIVGGVILGTSYALTEQRIMDPVRGVMLNPNLEQYKIAGARDVPDVEILLTEVHTGANNTGAIGIGEPATIPTAAAIACAVFDALGAPVRDLPLTPDRVLAALGAVPSKPAG
jgi:xanthine dehydrogenase YagR molybdenum-binding subunit